MKTIEIFSQRAFDAADEMHHVAVLLDAHEIGHLDGSEIADAAQVVSSQIHQHDVFRPLLLVSEQLPAELRVLFRRPAARARAGDRPVFDAPFPHLDQHLRGSAYEMQIVDPQKKHIWRGIDEAQRPIDVERITANLHSEALRQHNLENIACLNMRLGCFDIGIILRLAHVGLRFRDRLLGNRGRQRYRTRQALFDLLDAQQRVLIPGFDAFDTVLVEDIGDDVDSMLQVIEGEDGGKIHYLVIIQPQIILGYRWKFFKLADDIVGKIPDAAPEKWGQVRYRHRLEAAGYLPELVESSRFLADNLALALNRHGIPLSAHHDKGIPADEGISRQALAPFNALQQKNSAAAVGNAQECGGRSEKVSENILADRNNRSLLGNSSHFI